MANGEQNTSNPHLDSFAKLIADISVLPISPFEKMLGLRDSRQSAPQVVEVTEKNDGP